MELNKTVKAAVFSATAIGLGFLFMLVPNVEFITVTVFLSGLTLGAVTGGFVGASSIMIYSILNPLGSGLAYLPLLVGQIISMTGIGFFGALFGNSTNGIVFKLFSFKKSYLKSRFPYKS